ncbi:MAG: 50S ribosomal protein L23 [Candidatus Nanohalarchaeota archaeon]|nr:MAG: 50S ribosomal protein L23 [Candidatus Nanohaloarchaeota archaeon]
MESLEIIKCPYMTEKMTKNIELTNTLPFIVKRTANKPDIKRAVELMFDVKVEKVNTNVSAKGQKKAIVKLKSNYSAFDIASNMGMI